MLDTGLPFAAAGSCMNPGRAAVPSGGRSVVAAPPTGREVAGAEPPRNNVCGPLHQGLGAKWRGRAAAPSAGRSIAAAPPTGREVAEGNLYRPWAVTGPRTENRTGRRRPRLRPLHLHKQGGAREGVAGAAANARHHLRPSPSVRLLPGCAATS